MGGTDDPSNLMEVSVEEHTNLHLSLYLQYGKREDWVAFNMLLGQMGSEELFLERCRMGADKYWTNERREEHSKVMRKRRLGQRHSEETKRKISLSHTGRKKHTEESKRKLREANLGKVLSEETRKKISKNHNGLKPNKGKTWWTDGVNSKLLKECPENWWKGRTLNNKI